MFLFLQKRSKKDRKTEPSKFFYIFLRTGMKFLAYITEISLLLPESFGTPGIAKNNLLVYFKHNLSPQQHKYKRIHSGFVSTRRMRKNL